MKTTRAILAVGFCLALATAVWSQSAPSADGLLGARFESRAAGIALRPPAGSKQIRGAVGTTEVVEFLNDDKKWVVKLSRVLLDSGKPIPLTSWTGKDGKEYPGMLEMTVDQFKTDRPGSTILRQDTDSIGDIKVGLMAAKYDYGLETSIIQQAVIRADDLQYYILSMACPAPREGDFNTDPNVKLAVDTFTQMLSTVQIHDQLDLAMDRNERLMHTKMLYVNLTEQKLRSTLDKEQWFRLIKDGKDVGYIYQVEEVARDLPRAGKPEIEAGPEGVLVGIRSRLMPGNGVQTDGESWLFTTFDRKIEEFSVIAYTQGPGGKNTGGEVGSSRWREKPVADNTPGIGGKNVTLKEDYHLSVTKIVPNTSSDPIERDLPPYYVPRAIGQLLPRLVPVREPNTYLFATWVSDANQVVYRYLDVGREQDISLAGKKVRAVPIKDYIGLEGSVTTHYVSPEGRYLGCVNEDTKTTMLASDEQSLQRIWRNANLTRPGEVNRGPR